MPRTVSEIVENKWLGANPLNAVLFFNEVSVLQPLNISLTGPSTFVFPPPVCPVWGGINFLQLSLKDAPRCIPFPLIQNEVQIYFLL